MKRFAPLLTLLAVAVLGGGLFLVNTVTDPANQAAPAASAAPATTTADAAEPAPPGAEPPPPAVAEKAFTGRTSGNEVTVAIAVKDGRAVAYVCNGKEIEAWLEGTIAGGEVTLSSADGSTTITGTVDDTASLGTVTVGERSWPYAAKAVIAPAGLYEGTADIDGVANRIGWVVENDGTVTGNRRAAGEVLPAPELDPANPGAVVLDGVTVVVTEIDGGDAVIAR